MYVMYVMYVTPLANEKQRSCPRAHSGGGTALLDSCPPEHACCMLALLGLINISPGVELLDLCFLP